MARAISRRTRAGLAVRHRAADFQHDLTLAVDLEGTGEGRGVGEPGELNLDLGEPREDLGGNGGIRGQRRWRLATATVAGTADGAAMAEWVWAAAVPARASPAATLHPAARLCPAIMGGLLRPSRASPMGRASSQFAQARGAACLAPYRQHHGPATSARQRCSPAVRAVVEVQVVLVDVDDSRSAARLQRNGNG